jgi:hypothetical protein
MVVIVTLFQDKKKHNLKKLCCAGSRAEKSSAFDNATLGSVVQKLKFLNNAIA